jgi:hypothetical protein
MAAGSADPPPPEREQQQRYGMLELLRTRKDDGRSLILYSHDEPEGDGGELPPQAPTGERERA